MPISVEEAAKFSSVPSATKLKRFLDSAPTDEVFTPREVERAAGLGLKSIYGAVQGFDFGPYRLKVSHRCVYYGNPRAIATLRKRIGAK